jgi:hypothetical protein
LPLGKKQQNPFQQKKKKEEAITNNSAVRKPNPPQCFETSPRITRI